MGLGLDDWRCRGRGRGIAFEQREKAGEKGRSSGSEVSMAVLKDVMTLLAVPLTGHLLHFGWRGQRKRAAKLLLTARVNEANAVRGEQGRDTRGLLQENS